MGGGTAIIEGFVRGRKMVGSDLNSLAVFVARAKTTILTKGESHNVTDWASRVVPRLVYSQELIDADATICSERTRNLSIARARSIKKIIALCLESLALLPSPAGRRFARAVVLNVGQWALNSRAKAPTAAEFRGRIETKAAAMLDQLRELQRVLAACPHAWHSPILINEDASCIEQRRLFTNGERASLVVTSPPYPGIHMLYHRWQVDGRKETPAPYWITGGRDGKGVAYYNFADRRGQAVERYFRSALSSFRAIRGILRDGGIVVQLIAFADPERQLKQYLGVMDDAGFDEITRSDSIGRRLRVWRRVPSRAWHATLKGMTSSANEVVLVHRAR